MIYAKPGSEVEASIEGAASSLAGSGLRFRLRDTPEGVDIIARTTIGITEDPAGSGVYHKTFNAPTAEDTYMILWDTAAVNATPTPSETFTEELRVSRVTPVEDIVDYLPDVADVGALLRARTKDDMNDEIGTFNADTRPTGGEAATLINQAGNDVAVRVGSDFATPELQSDARNLISLRAAMLIELSYWPEQIENNYSAYAQYKALYDEGMKNLIKSVADAGAGGLPGASDDRPLASYAFPEDAGGFTGWDTKF